MARREARVAHHRLVPRGVHLGEEAAGEVDGERVHHDEEDEIEVAAQLFARLERGEGAVARNPEPGPEARPRAHQQHQFALEQVHPVGVERCLVPAK